MRLGIICAVLCATAIAALAIGNASLALVQGLLAFAFGVGWLASEWRKVRRSQPKT